MPTKIATPAITLDLYGPSMVLPPCFRGKRWRAFVRLRQMTGSQEGRLGIGAHWPRRIIILQMCKYYAVFRLRQVAGSASPEFPRAGERRLFVDAASRQAAICQSQSV